MDTKPLISLCLPTNGIIEWVFPVLDSIYNQNVDNTTFEVIVTNNGNNDKFHELMLEYSRKYNNLIYKKTNSFMFNNQLEALKLANGEFLKFVNHRSVFLENTLSYMINIVKENINNKPTIYFSNGVLDNKDYKLNSFDSFVKTLRRFISWTTGVGIWKDDYDKLPENFQFDTISPHSSILFSERKKELYIIDNIVFCKEITGDHSKKGNYDLFKAFGVEEVSIALKLYTDGDISAKTFKYVKNDYKKMLYELYWSFKILKRPCSYKLDGFNDSMGIFFNKSSILIGAWLHPFVSIKNKVIKIFRGL